MGGDDYVIDDNGAWNSPSEALEWYRAELDKARNNCERLNAALTDLVQQIEQADGTAQLSIEQAEKALGRSA